MTGFKKRPWVLIVLFYVSYASLYLCRLNLSVGTPVLKEQGLLTTPQLGILGSVFAIVYAFGRLVNGALSDRLPPWAMISTGLVFAGIANLAIGGMPPFWGVLMLWAVNALAQSMIWSSMLCVMSVLYDEETAKKRTAFLVTTVATGNLAGIVINTFLISRFGIIWAFILPGGVTLLLGFACAAAVIGVDTVRNATQESHRNMFELFADREVRTVLFPSVFHGVIKDNVTLWMTLFFVDRFGIDLNQSALFVLFIPLVGFLGRTLYPLCYRLCGYHEHLVSQYSFIVCLVASLVLCWNGLPPVGAIVCLSIIYAAVSMANTTFLSIYPIRFLSSGNVASVSGMMDFGSYLGASVSSLCFGFVIEQFGYLPMFATFAVLSLLSLLMLHRVTQ